MSKEEDRDDLITLFIGAVFLLLYLVGVFS